MNKHQLIYFFNNFNMMNKTAFLPEVLFIKGRKYRADFCDINLKIIVEYEGLFSVKSRHTTAKGYTGDCLKYNLAQINGFKVLRYTALNSLKEIEADLLQLI